MSTITLGVNQCTQIRYNFILKHLVRTKLALVMELSICWFGPFFLWEEWSNGHLVFNSVNMVAGGKYSYKKGDWKSVIQPITNKLCEEYGLSIVAAE